MSDEIWKIAPVKRPPTSDIELLDCIRVFIADAADRPIDTVQADTDIYEELAVDSLGASCVFIDISYSFGIPEPKRETDFAALNTALKIVAYVRAEEASLE